MQLVVSHQYAPGVEALSLLQDQIEHAGSPLLGPEPPHRTAALQRTHHILAGQLACRHRASGCEHRVLLGAVQDFAVFQLDGQQLLLRPLYTIHDPIRPLGRPHHIPHLQAANRNLLTVSQKHKRILLQTAPQQIQPPH